MKTNLIQRVGLAGCMLVGSLGFGGCSEVLLDIASKQSNPRKANSAYGLARMARDLERHEMNKEVAREGKSEVNVVVGADREISQSIPNYFIVTNLTTGKSEYFPGEEWKVFNGLYTCDRETYPKGFIITVYRNNQKISRIWSKKNCP